MKNWIKGTSLALLLSTGIHSALWADFSGDLEELKGSDDERHQTFKGLWDAAGDHWERAHVLRRFAFRYDHIQANEYTKAVNHVGGSSPYYVEALKNLLEETREGRLYSATDTMTYVCSFVASCLASMAEQEGPHQAVIQDMMENIASSPRSGGWAVMHALEKLPETYPGRVPALRHIVKDRQEVSDWRLRAVLLLPAEEQGPALEGIAGDPWTYLNNSAKALNHLPLDRRAPLVQGVWQKHQTQEKYLNVSPFILSDMAQTLHPTEPLRKTILGG